MEVNPVFRPEKGSGLSAPSDYRRCVKPGIPIGGIIATGQCHVVNRFLIFLCNPQLTETDDRLHRSATHQHSDAGSAPDQANNPLQR